MINKPMPPYNVPNNLTSIGPVNPVTPAPAEPLSKAPTDVPLKFVGLVSTIAIGPTGRRYVFEPEENAICMASVADVVYLLGLGYVDGQERRPYLVRP